ncbi:MAG: hypothetical protein ACI8S7_001948 [Candidatus Krumholzibacteriia bacterium]|jgi:hypothetical protein
MSSKRYLIKLVCLGALLQVLVSSALAQEYLPHFDPAGSGPLYTDEANGTTTAVPSLGAFYADQLEIKMDGVLDDEVWQHAQAGWGFRQANPNRGSPASVPTVFKVAYDDDAIYFAAACYEEDLNNISDNLSRRDEIGASDVVSIYIDPYFDRTTGYNFRVTPSGVIQDSYLFDNGSRDRDWNTVWQAEVSQDENGWYVEIRIPFSAIRFKPAEEMTWGLQAYRWMHGRGEDTGWVLWDHETSGFVSRWGNLTGLRGVDNPRKLEVLPYFVTKHVDPAAEGETDQWNNSQNIGADFKYGLTSNLTLNATFQPDFGQVEADPATLNLSPFETFFEEKRPFFIEGARFFKHQDFNLFYSRRIGTGDLNSRIRGAAKITGKIGGDVSIAVLAAATDVGEAGRTHNPFVSGTQKAFYGLVRLGKEFNEGNHRFSVMGTVVERNEASFVNASQQLQRNGQTGGFDFEMNFDDRNYGISGSAVGTKVTPFLNDMDPTQKGEAIYGTGGNFTMAKNGGNWVGWLNGRWESDKLDPNDMGFLNAPDEKVVAGRVAYNKNSPSGGSTFNQINFSADFHQSWFYAGNSGSDINTDQEVWSYNSSHRQSSHVSLNASAQHKSFNQAWIYAEHNPERSSKYTTRTFEDERGPLITRKPATYYAIGGQTDYRQPLSLSGDISYFNGAEVNDKHVGLNLTWLQSEHVNFTIGMNFDHVVQQSQWLTNQANDGSRPNIAGIGSVDYIFGKLDQKIWDVTLRTSVLFDRNRSLQLYLQPFLTNGDYTNPKYLATADSHDLRDYTSFDASQSDFNFGAVNLNMVYRWEYRPGSTVFLVWTHSKLRDESRGDAGNPPGWDNDFDSGFAFNTEPGNTFLVKFSYWFSI